MVKRILQIFPIIGLLIFIFIPKAIFAASATLSLSPAAGSFKVNDTFDVNVVLNAGGGKIGGVDIYLTFDQNKLNLLDIEKGSIFEQYVGKSISNSNGTAAISGMANSPQNAFSGTDTFAIFKFKAVSAGTSEVKFNFTPPNTRDSNVIDFDSLGDILTSVVNGTYTVTGVGGTGSTGPTGTTVTGPTATKTLPVTANEMPTILILLFGFAFIFSGVVIKRLSK